MGSEHYTERYPAYLFFFVLGVTLVVSCGRPYTPAPKIYAPDSEECSKALPLKSRECNFDGTWRVDRDLSWLERTEHGIPFHVYSWTNYPSVAIKIRGSEYCS